MVITKIYTYKCIQISTFVHNRMNRITYVLIDRIGDTMSLQAIEAFIPSSPPPKPYWYNMMDVSNNRYIYAILICSNIIVFGMIYMIVPWTNKQLLCQLVVILTTTIICQNPCTIDAMIQDWNRAQIIYQCGCNTAGNMQSQFGVTYICRNHIEYCNHSLV